MRVVSDGILVDIDSMTKALEETALVRSFRVAEQNGSLIVAVAEREPAHVFAVGHETGRWRTSGRTYTVPWVPRFTVHGGRVTRFDEWFDTASALATR